MHLAPASCMRISLSHRLLTASPSKNIQGKPEIIHLDWCGVIFYYNFTLLKKWSFRECPNFRLFSDLVNNKHGGLEWHHLKFQWCLRGGNTSPTFLQGCKHLPLQDSIGGWALSHGKLKQQPTLWKLCQLLHLAQVLTKSPSTQSERGLWPHSSFISMQFTLESCQKHLRCVTSSRWLFSCSLWQWDILARNI